MRRGKLFVGIASAVALATSIAWQPAIASNHFETPLAKTNPEFDLTDLYVFDAAGPDMTAFLLDINPTTKGDGSIGLGSNGIYSIHIANDTAMSGGMTLTFRYAEGKLEIGKVDDPNAPMGVMGDIIGSAEVGKVATMPNGLRIWFGGARDPFVGNGVGLAKFRTELMAGKVAVDAFDNKADLFEKLNVTALSIEVPNSMLPSNINVFATSAMKKDGAWSQINRAANVLYTHVFLLADPTLATQHVTSGPDADAKTAPWISAMVARTVSIIHSQPDPVAYGDKVAKMLTPDMIPYKVGTKAHYTFGSPINGRSTRDDSMDTVMSMLVGKKMNDQAQTFDRQPAAFPYVIPTGK